jgi:hypothetical protein
MKRAFLFLVLGPLSVFVTIFVMFVAVSGARSLGVAQSCAMVVARPYLAGIGDHRGG